MHPLRDLTLAELRTRTSIKWTRYAPDVLPLWVAEMDVRLAEPVERALVDVVRRGDTGYPSADVYAEAWAGFAAERWGLQVDPARTAPVADVMTGVVETLGLVSAPGDPVVISPPVYPPFFGYVQHAGRSVVEAPLAADGRLDLDALGTAFERAAFGGRRATYLLCSPHNPTGAVHSRLELEAVARLAAQHRVRVVVDEIHALLAGPDFVPYLDVTGSDDAYAVVSASKAWNLAGAKAALVVGGPATAGDLRTLPEVVSHGPSHLGTVAHVAALREGVPWLDALLVDLAENREQVRAFLAERLPDVAADLGPGTYLGWLDLQSGLDFRQGAGRARLNYATTPEILVEALERVAVAVGR